VSMARIAFLIPKPLSYLWWSEGSQPLEYCPPQGPSNINDPKSPGIHGTSHGMARSPSASRGSGSGLVVRASFWITTGMTAEVDIGNRALSAIGTRSQIADLSE
jgi:hypothetical protein